MRYYLKIVISGSFPGSPDTDTMEIGSDEFFRLHERMLKSGKSDIGIAKEEFTLP